MTTSQNQPTLGSYRPLDDNLDPLVEGVDGGRAPWTAIADALHSLGLDELHRRGEEAVRLLSADGVNYRVIGPPISGQVGSEPGDSRHQPDGHRLDPVPAVLASAEWSSLERGIIQRAELLDLIAIDLYGPRNLIARGLLPPEVVFGHPGFVRACDGQALPGGRQLFNYAADLVHGPDGSWQVLADQTQSPSGAGYALENRVVTSRVFPSLYREAQVHRLAPFFRSLRSALQAMAPPNTNGDPRIVVLTAGPWSETAFEQAFLASYLGYSLVEPGDLFVRDGRLWLRAVAGPEPVDVVVRGVDASMCDPLELRPDSRLGIPGLLEVVRRGAVAVLNGLGSGVLENPALAVFLPDLAQELLGQSLRLASVQTWWCGQAQQRSHVLANLASLVLKQVIPGPSPQSCFGWELSAGQREELSRRIQSDPAGWVGQLAVQPATTPTLAPGGLEPRAAIVRAFAVTRGDSYAVMPGALTRVGPDSASLRISQHSGAITKDTWVLASEPEATSGFWLQRTTAGVHNSFGDGSGPGTGDGSVVQAVSARAAENLFWVGRYAERADAAVRLLRVVHDRRNDLAGGSNAAGTACLHVLLTALRTVTGGHPGAAMAAPDNRLGSLDPADLDPDDLGAELVGLAVDSERPGTVAYAVAHLLAAAEAVRDQLSVDTFLVIGNLHRHLAEHGGGSPEGRDLHAQVQHALSQVLSGLLAFAGLAAESMVRDAGWQFMEAGRRVERGLHLAMLLRATVAQDHGTATDSLLFESVLTASESIITYRRRYRSRARLDTLLDLLLVDDTNPRSLLYQIERLREAIDLVPRPSAGLPARLGADARLILELSTRLRLADTRLLAGRQGDAELRTLLERVELSLRAIADAIDESHFTHLPPLQALGGA